MKSNCAVAHPDCRGGPLWPPIRIALVYPSEEGQTQGSAPTRYENQNGPGQPQAFALRIVGAAPCGRPSQLHALTPIQGRYRGLCSAREERRQDACATRYENLVGSSSEERRQDACATRSEWTGVDYRLSFPVRELNRFSCGGSWPGLKIRPAAPNCPANPLWHNASDTCSMHPKSVLLTSSCLPCSGKIANGKTIPSPVRS